MLAYALGYLSNVRFAQAIPAGQIFFLVRPAIRESVYNHAEGGPGKAEAYHPV